MKRVSVISFLWWILFYSLSSCGNAVKFSISSKVIVDKLDDDYGFRVVSANPLAEAGVVTWRYYSHALVGRHILRRPEWDIIDPNCDRTIFDENRAWLENRLGVDEDGLKEKYGEFRLLKRYADFCVAVTRLAKQDGSAYGEIKTAVVEIDVDAKDMRLTYFSRVGNEFRIALLNKVVNLDTMEVSSREVEKYRPEWLLGIDEALEKAEDFMEKAPEIKDIYENTLGGTTLFCAVERDGMLFYAASRSFASYSSLYCLIFDAETGEVLYAAVCSTPDMGDDSDKRRFKGSFELAEPVIINGNSYYDLL